MPTTYSDQFFIIDPYSPPPVGTALNFTTFTLTDQNDDNDFDRYNNDQIDGVDITRSWPGDTVTVDVPGVGPITYTGVTFYLADGRQVFTPNDGQVLQNGTLNAATGVTTEGPLTIPELGPACFTPGTMIEVADGRKAIETLVPGDLVATRDNGLQPILWIGRKIVRAVGDFAPIRFEKGALGNDLPERDMLVSPNHRMLVANDKTSLYFEEREVLVAAKHLVNNRDIVREEVIETTYLHFMFDNHEVVLSDGAWTESFQPGDMALKSVGNAQRNEIMELFPELATQDGINSYQSARKTLKAHEASLLVR